jgi:two-component system sensor histidine kinase KdpD
MQYFISVALVILISAVCFSFSQVIGYKVVALILLMTVSLLAMLFDIFPVLSAALMSALIWNYFFIPPLYTFHIESAEDSLMFLMYFVIAMVNAALSFKIREKEKHERDKEEKENTIRLYNTLLNSLSHEIRTPLSTIVGAVDTLKENKESLTSQNKNELFDEIDIASIRLNRQVENLLSMSRLETGMLQLKKDWCDINELVFSVIQEFPGTHGKVKIRFEADEELPLFKLDAGLIENVLHNLIHNAIQYTPENSQIMITAVFQNENLCISISDNGNGIPEKDMHSVFDKFYRLPHTKAGGTGLGLSIVKGFVQAHNGKVLLENANEGGAKFTILIPAETSFISNLKNE